MLDNKNEKNYHQSLNHMLAEDNNSDNFKLGIILLSVFIVVLLIIAGVYLFRSKDITSLDKTQEKEPAPLVDRLLGGAARQTEDKTDTDQDGLSDEAELAAKTDLSKTDTDEDGLNDREEIMVYKTNPLKPDTDNDGVNDGQEIKDRRDPLDPSPSAIWPPRPTDLSPNK